MPRRKHKSLECLKLLPKGSFWVYSTITFSFIGGKKEGINYFPVVRLHNSFRGQKETNERPLKLCVECQEALVDKGIKEWTRYKKELEDAQKKEGRNRKESRATRS